MGETAAANGAAIGVSQAEHDVCLRSRGRCGIQPVSDRYVHHSASKAVAAGKGSSPGRERSAAALELDAPLPAAAAPGG